MRNVHGYCVVPVNALRPIMQEWVERQDIWRLDKRDKRDAQKQVWVSDGVVEYLMELSGIPRRRIQGILNDSLGQENVTFDTADSLLCAMNMQHEWHTRLAEHYGPLEVASYERDLSSEEEMAA